MKLFASQLNLKAVRMPENSRPNYTHIRGTPPNSFSGFGSLSICMYGHTGGTLMNDAYTTSSPGVSTAGPIRS